MDATCFSETSVDFRWTTQSYKQEDGAVVYHYLLKQLKLWLDEEWTELFYWKKNSSSHFQNLRQMSGDKLNSAKTWK
jgi:hypothetical protein